MTLAKASVSAVKGDPSADGAAASNDPGMPYNMAMIEALGGVLKDKREEAMNWRAQSGIENDWNEDEEFYQSVDRANPEGETNVGKPASPDGGAIGIADRAKTPSKSSVFIPITRAYVDAAAARVADMLLPNDDQNWQIKPTPIPNMGQQTPVAQAAQAVAGAALNGQPIAPATPGPATTAMPAMGGPEGMAGSNPVAPSGGQAPQPGQQPPPPPSPMGVATNALSDEEKRAEAATKRINDWLVECQWHAEVRKVIEDSALLGTGVLKGPVPRQRKAFKTVFDGVTRSYRLEATTETVPVSYRVNPRNFWTDPAGGENHQRGSYCWELDNIGTRLLMELMKDDTYITENIIQALREGPGNRSGKQDSANSNAAWQVDIGSTFPLWYFHGDISKRDMIAAGVPEDELPEGEPEAVAVPAMVIIVNDRVIKVAEAPLEAGGMPYDMFPWQRRAGIPHGKGVARQVRTPQRMLNAAVRAEMDNGALSSGPLYAIRKSWVMAIDGNNATLTPRKGFYMTAEAPPTAKIQDAISFTNIESNIQSLELVIDRALRFAEDSTGLPMLMQGQQGEATTTATGMTILNNNGSTVLRRIARTFDDYITEPHIRRYYYWLMAHKGNDEAKGDFQIDARGSTYLVERDLQAANLNQLFPMFAQHPDVHPGRLAEEVAKANKINFKQIMLTDQEKAEKAKQPPPESPQEKVAKINAGAKLEDRKMTLTQKEANDQRTAQLAEGKLQSDVEKFLGEAALKYNISTDNIKAMLATAVMKLGEGDKDREHSIGGAREQRAHERTSAAEERAANPPEEMPGRAPAGEAWSK